MNQPVRTSKSVYAIFGAGLLLGGVSMAGELKGGVVSTAYASQDFKPRVIGNVSVESMTELRNLDNSIANLADFTAPAVVDIQSTKGRSMGPNGERTPVTQGEGSGFIIRPDGYIVTNDHVVGGFDTVKVTLKDGREFDGKVTRAQDSDIAIVKIDANNLPTLSFGDSSKVRPGQTSMAVGAPFGLQFSVTVGHVSALGREEEIEGRLYPTLIQTDTSINMGNSGGPLVNIDGQVIGVNTAIYSPSGVSSGIGFAIPANQAKLIADMLINKGKVTRSMLGLQPENLKDYEKAEKHLDGGAVVRRVTSDGPANAAGIKTGDIIVKIGTTPITSELDLRNAMLEYAPGSTVPVELVRDGNHMTVSVKLIAYKEPQVQQMQQQPFEQGPGGQRFEIPRGLQIPRGFMDPFDQGQGEEAPAPMLPQGGKPRFGVTVEDATADVRSQFNIPASVSGAVVAAVVPGSLADNLGLTPGDVITSFGGKKINGAQALTNAVKAVKSGGSAKVHYVRYSDDGSAESDLTVKFK